MLSSIFALIMNDCGSLGSHVLLVEALIIPTIKNAKIILARTMLYPKKITGEKSIIQL